MNSLLFFLQNHPTLLFPHLCQQSCCHVFPDLFSAPLKHNKLSSNSKTYCVVTLSLDAYGSDSNTISTNPCTSENSAVSSCQSHSTHITEGSFDVDIDGLNIDSLKPQLCNIKLPGPYQRISMIHIRLHKLRSTNPAIILSRDCMGIAFRLQSLLAC